MKPVGLGFEAQLRNLRSSSPCAQCRSHIISPDLSIIKPPSTWSVLDHHQSSAPGLLLLPRSSSLSAMSHLSPTHHETSKRDSPQKIDSSVKHPKYPRFEFKPWYVNNSSQSNQCTDHLVSHRPYAKVQDQSSYYICEWIELGKWFKNLPLSFYMSHLHCWKWIRKSNIWIDLLLDEGIIKKLCQSFSIM
jgi:hypothetical protein